MAFKLKDLDETQAPLLDHLIELRKRLMRAVMVLVVAFGICLYFADPILGFLVQPLKDAFPDGDGQLIFTKLYEVFFVELKVAFFAGFCLSFPIIANQLWAFVAPGLYAREKKAFLPFLIATPVLFIAGASLAYYMVMPVAFEWFIGFEGETGGLEVEALPSASEYLSLVMQFILAFGLCFELPVLLLLLHRAGIVTRAQFASSRRYILVLCFILGAIFTPAEPVSQLLLAIPLYILFEGSLLLMYFSEKKQAEASEDDDEEEEPEGAASES